MQTTHVAIDSGNAKKAGMVIDQGLETRGIEVLFAHQIDQDTRIEIAAAAILPPSALDVSTPEVLLSFERTSFLGVGLVLIFLSSLVIVFPNADLSDRVDPPLSFIRRRLVSFGLITPWCIAAVIAVNYYDSCGGGAKVFHASQLASNQGPSPARGCCAACCLPRSRARDIGAVSKLGGCQRLAAHKGVKYRRSRGVTHESGHFHQICRRDHP
jgi:hypothetical protein